MIPGDAKPNGWFDFVTPDYAWGWACDPTYTNEDSAGIQVNLYAEDGTFLGSITPNIYREQLVADRCGGAHNRSFQFSLPPSFQTDAKRAVYAFTENRDGSGRSLIGGGPKTVTFRNQLEEVYGNQPFITSSMVDTIIQSNLEPENGNGNFRVATHCYGTSADDLAVSWEPSSFTGFSTGSLSSARLPWQRGSANMFGEMVVQAKESTVGIFTIAGGAGWDSNCGNIAGAVTGFAWNPGQTPSPPKPWPSGSQSSLAKELIIQFSGKFKSAEGAAYVHPVLFFRDTTNNLRIWIDPQAFDARPGQSEEFIGNDCPVGANCTHEIAPIVATAFGISGSYGRTLSGDFFHTTSNSYRSFEFRINGFQFENALIAVGCSNSDSLRLSCNAEDYQLTMTALLAEVAGFSSSMGTSLKTIYFGRTKVGTL